MRVPCDEGFETNTFLNTFWRVLNTWASFNYLNLLEWIVVNSTSSSDVDGLTVIAAPTASKFRKPRLTSFSNAATRFEFGKWSNLGLAWLMWTLQLGWRSIRWKPSGTSLTPTHRSLDGRWCLLWCWSHGKFGTRGMHASSVTPRCRLGFLLQESKMFQSLGALQGQNIWVQ